MVNLNSVLSGLTKSLTEVQVGTDQVSLGYVREYQKDELLKHIEVPKISIKNVGLKLRFAIENVQQAEPDRVVLDAVNKEWVDIIQQQVIPDIIKKITESEVIASVLTQSSILSLYEKIPLPQLGLKEMLIENQKLNLDLSIAYIENIIRILPDDLRKKLPAIERIKKTASVVLEKFYLQEKKNLINSYNVQMAMQTNLNILVDKNSLATVPQEQIHELNIELDMDFIGGVENEQKE